MAQRRSTSQTTPPASGPAAPAPRKPPPAGDQPRWVVPAARALVGLLTVLAGLAGLLGLAALAASMPLTSAVVGTLLAILYLRHRLRSRGSAEEGTSTPRG